MATTPTARIAANARAKLYGEPTDGERKARDLDTADRWARAEGADSDGEAEKARQKLGNMSRGSLDGEDYLEITGDVKKIV